jgi:hypothetical protein
MKSQTSRPRGQFEERYWAITNSLGRDGFVHWMINRADEVTELFQLRGI